MALATGKAVLALAALSAVVVAGVGGFIWSGFCSVAADIAKKNIPVDIVFRQGREVLGL